MSKTNFPEWLKRKLPSSVEYNQTLALITKYKLNTVCDSARCPNMGECFSRKTATFLIMGNVCTRGCLFCDITCGIPGPLAKDEPKRILEAVKTLGLKYVVITSVTRDDLPDGGAAHFASVIKALRVVPKLKIEVLVPDFLDEENSLKKILAADPDVIAHNVEMVQELYSKLRPASTDYNRSLQVLKNYKRLKPDCITKTGFMVGFGETRAQVSVLIGALAKTGCKILTIGQYLKPSKGRAEVFRFVPPAEFEDLKAEALAKGFEIVYSGPFVRSSYNAGEVFKGKTDDFIG